jgi:PIN domain nuclease of toxin-antitoxin system
MLSEVARTVVEEERIARGIRVSAISVWELCMLVKKGRLVLTVSPATFLRHAERLSYLDYLPVDNQIARASVGLPDVHADPADRLIVATALALSCPIVSRDGRLAVYPGVQVVW